jgi:hypothetical protein
VSSVSGHALFWDKNDGLAFAVYQKEGRALKHLNSDSTRPPHVFRARMLTAEVLARLANLMTCDDANKMNTMKKVHQDHCKALDDVLRRSGS